MLLPADQAATYKGRPSPDAPRTDPDERVSRIRLLPRVFDGKADARPGVKDARLWEPVVGHLAHPLPGQCVLLAAAPQRPPPKPDDMVTERAKRPRVGRHGVVGIVAGDDRGRSLIGAPGSSWV